MDRENKSEKEEKNDKKDKKNNVEKEEKNDSKKDDIKKDSTDSKHDKTIVDSNLSTSPIDFTLNTTPIDFTLSTNPIDSTLNTNPTYSTVSTNSTDSSLNTNPTFYTVNTTPIDFTLSTNPIDSTLNTNPTYSIVNTNPTGSTLENQTNKETKNEKPELKESNKNTKADSNLVRPWMSYASSLKGEQNAESNKICFCGDLACTSTLSQKESSDHHPKTVMNNLLNEFSLLKTKSTVPKTEQSCLRPNEIKEFNKNQKNEAINKDGTLNTPVRLSTSPNLDSLQSFDQQSNQDRLDGINRTINQPTNQASNLSGPFILDMDYRNMLIDDQQPSTSKSPTEISEMPDQSDDQLRETLANSIQNEFKCSICMQVIVNATSLNCSHVFCKTCIVEWLEKNKNCPECRRPQIGRTHHVLAIDNFLANYYQKFTTKTEQKTRTKQIKDHKKKDVIVISDSEQQTTNNINRPINLPLFEPELFEAFNPRTSRSSVRARRRRNQAQRRERARRLDRVDGISENNRVTSRELRRYAVRALRDAMPNALSNQQSILMEPTTSMQSSPVPEMITFSPGTATLIQTPSSPVPEAITVSPGPILVIATNEGNLTSSSSTTNQSSTNQSSTNQSSSNDTSETVSTSLEVNTSQQSTTSNETRRRRRTPRRRSRARRGRSRVRRQSRSRSTRARARSQRGARSRSRRSRARSRSRRSRARRSSRRRVRSTRAKRPRRASNRRERSQISQIADNDRPRMPESERTRNRQETRRRRQARRRVRRAKRSSINNFVLNRES